MVYTGRDDGPFTNHVAGADGRCPVRKHLLGAGLARGESDGGSDEYGIGAARTVVRRSKRTTISRALLVPSIADDFHTASGYISRDSIAHANFDHGIRFFGREGGFLQTGQFDLVLDGTWRYSRFVDRGDMIEKKMHFNTNFVLRGGWNAGASVLVESFGFDPDLYRNYYIERTVGTAIDTVKFTGVARIPNLDYVLSLTTPNFQHLNLSALYIWGRDENFFEWASGDIGYMTVSADWRPTTQLRISNSYIWQSYRRRTDGYARGRESDSASQGRVSAVAVDARARRRRVPGGSPG